ncbi:MAG: carbohydrate ABC transporter permease [Nitrososphaerota archaeon]
MNLIKIFSLIIIALWGIFIIGPLYVTFISGFKDLNDVFTTPPKLIPFIEFQLTLDAYYKIFSTDIGGTFINSLIIASTATLIAMIVSILSAYGFSRFPHASMNTPGSFFQLLTLRMVPPFAVALPILTYWSMLGLVDTYPALIWTYTVFSIPLSTWLLKGFIDDIPKRVEDAARVDGYNFTLTFRKLILPLLMTGIAATLALTWLFLWNEFLFALKIAGGKVVTYTVKLPQLRHAERIMWNVYGAMGLISVIPPILILLAFRKHITRLYVLK